MDFRAASITGVVILVSVVITIYVWYKRYKRKKKKENNVMAQPKYTEPHEQFVQSANKPDNIDWSLFRMTESCEYVVKSGDETDIKDRSQLRRTESCEDATQSVDEADTIDRPLLRLTKSGDDVVQSVDEANKDPTQNSPRDLRSICSSQTELDHKSTHILSIDVQPIPREEDILLQAAFIVLYTVPRAIEDFINREYKGGLIQAIHYNTDKLKTKVSSKEWELLSKMRVHHRLYHFYDQIIQDTSLDKDVLDLLISKCILRIEDRTEIEHHPRPSDRNKCILDLLIQRSEDSFCVLLEVLKESPTCYTDLIECMESQQLSHHKAVSHSKVKSRSGHSVRLRRNYRNLTKNLSNTESIIDSLISKKVLDPDNRAEINNSGVQAKINRKLIDHIRSKQDYHFFLEALKEDPPNAMLASDLESMDVTQDELKLLETGATVTQLTNRPGFKSLVTLVSIVKDVQIPDTEPESHDTSIAADLYRLQYWYNKIIKMSSMDLDKYQLFVQTVNEIVVRIGGNNDPDVKETSQNTGTKQQVQKILDCLKEKEENSSLKEKIIKMETELEDVIPKNIRASSNGHTDIVKLLLEKNPNVDLCDKYFNSPLLLASNNGHTDIVKLLLEKNPNVDQCDKDGNSSLLLASHEGDTDTVKLLLEKNPNVDLCDKDGNSSLLLAIDEEHTDIVKLLLEKNPNVDLCDQDGSSPLLLASSNGHTDIVKLLLEKNPNVDLCDKDGFTPLITVCSSKHTSITQLLLKHKPNINAQTFAGSNALHFSSLNGNLEITQLLLENNADCNICCCSKQSLLDTIRDRPTYTLQKLKQGFYDYLMQYASSHVADYVKKKSADYVFDMEASCSPLHFGCFMGWTDVVHCLLNHNASINIKKEDGTTPLYFACEVGHEDIVRLLLEKGANTSICKLEGKSPLHIAIDNEHTSIVMMVTEQIKK